MRIDWIVGQTFFWVLVMAIVITGVIGVRRAGAVLTAHQAGLVGGRSSAGTEQALVQASSDLSTWWGSAPATSVEVVQDAGRKSILIRVRGGMAALFGQTADLGAGSFQRIEDFYPAPPSDDGWE